MEIHKLPKLPNFNQNVLVLVVGLVGLGLAEHFGLKTLYQVSLIISIVMVVLVLLSMASYTIGYCVKKLKE